MATPLTLQQSFEHALQRSETVAIQESNIQMAESKFRQAVGGVLPQVHFKAVELLQDDSAGAAAGSVASTLTRFSRPELKFTATQPIFSGFREFHALEAFRAQRRGSEASFENSRRTLFLDVAEIFYMLLQLEKETQIFGKTIGTLRRRLRDMDRRIELGKSPLSDRFATQAEFTGEI